jgi:TonB family protein
VGVTFGGGLNGSLGVSIFATGPASAKALNRRINGDPDITMTFSSFPECAEGWFYKYPDEEEIEGHEGILLGFNKDDQLCHFEEIEDQTNRIEAEWLVEPVEIDYPIEGVVKGIEGKVTFSFTVDEDGTVLEKSIIDSSDEMFSAAVMEGFATFQVDPKAFAGEEFPYTHKVRFPFAPIQIDK